MHTAQSFPFSLSPVAPFRDCRDMTATPIAAPMAIPMAKLFSTAPNATPIPAPMAIQLAGGILLCFCIP